MKLIKPDSAGIIYPYVKSKDRASVFRIETELKEKADISVLLKAVSDISKRFPTFFVKLVTENKMYKMKPAEEHNVVYSEMRNVCRTFNFDKDIPLRVVVHDNRISLEIFHLLADGHGAVIFFKSLLAQYYKLMGESIEYDDEILNPSDAPDEEELRDAFLDIYKGGNKNVSRTGKFAYQYCKNEPHTKLNITQLKVSSDDIYKLAKQYNTTVGVLLISIYIYSFYSLKNRKSKKQIKISVPADLRRIFPSKTLRNFSLYAIVGISPAKCNWTLESIIAAVSNELKEQLSKENLLNMAYTNVTSANTKFFELLPLPLKKAVLCFGFDFMGERLFTSALSNLGVMELPECLKKHITDVRWFVGEAMVNQINAVTVTYNGYTNIIFSSRVLNDEVQKQYAYILNDHGIEVKYITRIHGTKDYI